MPSQHSRVRSVDRIDISCHFLCSEKKQVSPTSQCCSISFTKSFLNFKPGFFLLQFVIVISSKIQFSFAWLSAYVSPLVRRLCRPSKQLHYFRPSQKKTLVIPKRQTKCNEQSLMGFNSTILFILCVNKVLYVPG